MRKRFFDMSKTMRSIFVIALAVFITNCGLISAAYAIENNPTSPEIVVTVVCGNIDEAELASMEFDDGTHLQDFIYTVEYVENTENSLQRGSLVPLSTFFESVVWILRSDGYTLAIDPLDDVRASPSLWGPAWECLFANCSSDMEWGYNNEDVMYWQFMCHANFANQKATWNIEPWRTADTYGDVVLHACNP